MRSAQGSRRTWQWSPWVGSVFLWPQWGGGYQRAPGVGERSNGGGGTTKDTESTNGGGGTMEGGERGPVHQLSACFFRVFGVFRGSSRVLTTSGPVGNRADRLDNRSGGVGNWVDWLGNRSGRIGNWVDWLDNRSQRGQTLHIYIFVKNLCQMEWPRRIKPRACDQVSDTGWLHRCVRGRSVPSPRDRRSCGRL